MVECKNAVENCDKAVKESKIELSIADEQLAVHRDLVRTLTIQRNEAYKMVDDSRSLPWYYHASLGAAATATCLNAPASACAVGVGGLILFEIIGGLIK